MVFVTTTIGIWCHEQLPEIHYSVSDLQRRLEVSVIFGPNSTRIISLRSPDSSRPHRKSTPTADQRQSGTLLRSAVNSRSLCFHRLLMTQRKSFLYATNCQADLLIARVVGHFVYLSATGPIWVLCDQLNGPMLKNVFGHNWKLCKLWQDFKLCSSCSWAIIFKPFFVWFAPDESKLQIFHLNLVI